MDYPPNPEYADVTPEIAAEEPTAPVPTGGSGATQPRLADRLSALVGQAASRQEDSVSAERLVAAIAARVDAATAELRERIAVVEAGQAARMTELESLVGDRLKAIEAAVGAQADDPGVKAHLDEVGGALVLRLDEVLAASTGGDAATQAALTGRLDETRHQLATQLEEARGQLAGQVTETQTHLSGQVEVSRVALEEFEQTLLGHIGDLAAGVVELGEGTSLTRADLDDAMAGIPALFDGVAQAAQLDGVTASTTALREELDGVVGSLASMRAEFNGLQAAIEKRVDDAALALAETLVAVITSMPAVQSAPTISYDFDNSFGTTAAPRDGTEPAFEPIPEAGEDGDWAAADSVEELTEIELLEESAEQASGVDEGSAAADTAPDTDPGVGTLENAFTHGDDAESPARRKGLFRR